ncbi:hypothetical protein SUGI_0700470 [Cryptomeria japonica]|uniref:uncharacterized protein LOC131050685 n=1 Tax=Cryptomeria japonica TaxID=3369 RepID=UPI002414A98B|nr:uncharacterized protein LOC131050685 [Cryptomeria japonica]GLJ34800.1 hypothetical protein SUGI_0700470 [Cryptomeria japonica]
MERSVQGNSEQRTETTVEDSLGTAYQVTQISRLADDLPGMRSMVLRSTNSAGESIRYETYVCNDGEITDEDLLGYFHTDITNPERYLPCNGIRRHLPAARPILFMTNNQIAFPLYADLVNRSRSNGWDVRLELVYDRTVPPTITAQEAAEIVGLPTTSLDRSDYPEIICAICLEVFEDDNDEIKQLGCGHIFHYQCILRSTQLQPRCPICRRQYDSPPIE